ncbi:hypothetical protein ACFVXK_35685, partial [Streptomyces sp. NPDC058157]
MERIVEEIREDLDRRLALAADRLTDRALAQEPAWAAPLGRAGVRERIRLVLRRLLEGLVGAGRGEPVDVADARAAGAERAGRGLPLDPLRRTYREGARLVWQCLTEAVAAHDRSALARLPAGPDALWDVVDRLTDAASEAYHRAGAEREDRERERRAALLDALLDGPGAAAPDPESAASAAARLGLPARGRFAVVVLAPARPGAPGRPGFELPGAPGPGADPGGPAATGTGAGAWPDAPRVLWRVRADGETGLAELGHHPLES